ncbi:MAG: helix-turn-helix domain-containing protein [Proteobacteria bacterium]|nr:helix-turn-helix domain-containing protein [Pseudomonadota bacterium]
MKNRAHTILLTDSDYRRYNEDLLTSLSGFNLVLLMDEESVRNHFLKNDVDIILLGHNGDPARTELLDFFKSVKPSVPVIIITDDGDELLAVKLFRNGARDYFKKPFSEKELRRSIITILGLREGSIKRNLPNGADGLKKAIRYINDNYETHIRLPMAAHEAGMSVSHFEREFKEKMETTFISYVNNLKINHAIKLLEDERLSMSDIAFACGFSNQWHFNRIFKRITSKTPTSFRKSLKK